MNAEMEARNSLSMPLLQWDEIETVHALRAVGWALLAVADAIRETHRTDGSDG